LVRRETQNILLVLLGGALLKISLNGTFLRYVKPALQPWLILSGTIMVVLAAVAIISDIRRARRQAAAESSRAVSHGHSHSGSGHDHSHGSARSAWMLLAPVMAIFLIAPPALGADSVDRAGGRTVASQQRQDQVIKTQFPPLPGGAPLRMKMADVATRAAWDATNSLNGRTLALTGFVVHQNGELYVARLVITCCAADAMPVKAQLTGPGLDSLADDQWITVTGKVKPDSAMRADNYVPIFETTSVHKVGTPEDPYEY
jgi:uncharacterized repeat protein (TIGR03943 family)